MPTTLAHHASLLTPASIQANAGFPARSMGEMYGSKRYSRDFRAFQPFSIRCHLGMLGDRGLLSLDFHGVEGPSETGGGDWAGAPEIGGAWSVRCSNPAETAKNFRREKSQKLIVTRVVCNSLISKR